MKLINIAAGPGAGKSTVAAGLFYEFKMRGLNVELVTEWIKDAVWEERSTVYTDQIYIFAKQNRKLERLRNKVDFIISDSPLLLSLAYIKNNYYKNFETLVKEVHDSYRHLNIIIDTDYSTYQENGRLQNREQAISKHKEIIDLFKIHDSKNTIYFKRNENLKEYTNMLLKLYLPRV